MFNLAVCAGFAGLFSFGLGIIYLAVVSVMYIGYRLTNGKMSFREYIKYW